MSAPLWCELMNWLGQRPSVYIFISVMSRSLRVIMSAQRPPLSQSVLRLVPWESLHTCFQALQPLPHPGPMGVLVSLSLPMFQSQTYTPGVEGS